MGLFETKFWPARWYCGDWADHEWLGWMHIIGDVLTFAAYVVVPFLIYYWRRKLMGAAPKLVVVGWVFTSLFFLLCGGTHGVDAIIWWHPVYHLLGWIKVSTPIVSWAAVLCLVGEVKRWRTPREYESMMALLYAVTDADDSAVYAVDLDGVCTFANNQIHKLTGFSQRECMGLNMHRLIHHHHADGRAYPVQDCKWFACINTRQGVHMHDTIWNKDGDPVPVTVLATPLLVGTNVIGCRIALVRRTTEDLVKAHLNYGTD